MTTADLTGIGLADALEAAKDTRAYRAGMAFDVPADGVEQFTADVIRAAAPIIRRQERERIYKNAHLECDCVPDLGPSHCHLCSERAGREMPWSEAHPTRRAVAREIAQAMNPTYENKPWLTDEANVGGALARKDAYAEIQDIARRIGGE